MQLSGGSSLGIHAASQSKLNGASTKPQEVIKIQLIFNQEANTKEKKNNSLVFCLLPWRPINPIGMNEDILHRHFPFASIGAQRDAASEATSASLLWVKLNLTCGKLNEEEK